MKTYTSGIFNPLYAAIGSDDPAGQDVILFQVLHSNTSSDSAGHEPETTCEIMHDGGRTISMTDRELEIWLRFMIS
jgi:hypothetical protein